MTALYKSHRKMRAKRQDALRRGAVAVLDIGTFKIACMILKFTPQDHKTASDADHPLTPHGAIRVASATATRSRGVKFGEIETMHETERAIRTALQSAQSKAQLRVDHAIVCLSGGRVQSFPTGGEIDIPHGVVREHDVARVLDACPLPDLGAGRELLHAQPVNFRLDHRSGLYDPRGQVGNVLSTDMHMLSADSNTLDAVINCIKRCDLELAGVAAAPYVAAMASLIEDERELGAACIDMGAGVTSLSIFAKRHMIYADYVRMGGDHVTGDISMGLHIPMADAERIKTRFGGVVATGMDDGEIIELSAQTGDWHYDRRSVTRSELIGVIRPRIEEILEDVRAKLDKAGFQNLPSRRIVLTGGASQIPGLDTLATRILGHQVRLGRPLRIRDLPQQTSGPEFSALVGVSLFAALPQDEWWDFKTSGNVHHPRSLKRIIQWVQDNW